MLKKLLIPAFICTVAALGVTTNGCGSDPATTGKAGSGGGAGTGAAGAAGTGAAGAAGTGAAGAAGTGAAGAAGTGAAGAAGTGAAGAAGTGAAGAAGTGAAGADAGAAGTGAAGADAGAAGTGAAGADGGAAGSDGGTALPACTSTSAASPAVTPEAFCANMIAACTGIAMVSEPYLTMATCVTTYTARTTAQKMCQSYHLCVNSVGKVMSDKVTHCPHAGGMTPCN